MSFPHSHKTVLVVDKTPSMCSTSQQTVELDALTKAHGPSMIPLAPIKKSLWTCNVEAAVEFCRIVFDVYPAEKLIRVVSSDTQAQSLNTWAQNTQNISHVITSLGQAGAPNPKARDTSLLHGLSAGIEALCELTPKQEDMISEGLGDSVYNRGHIICLTHLNSESQLKSLEECVQDTLTQHNGLASRSDGKLLPIDDCDLTFIHIVPIGGTSSIIRTDKRQLSENLRSAVHVTQSGKHVSHKLIELAVHHYQLSSTTVIGIPMKEEQNASSSANYDVELLHPAAAHDELIKTGGTADGLLIPSKEGLPIDTYTLKWCTPKSNVVELHPCTGSYRVTPVDVNSRPSSCLTNFLLNGRSVMLEQPRKTGNKIISHMLTSHGGELYIHVLVTSRSIIEDPPSISEGCGGRITDYRINDFGELMKESRLAPAADVSQHQQLPVSRARDHLERMTRHWPMVIGDTIIFNMLSFDFTGKPLKEHLDPLPSLIVKKHLEDDEVLDCKKAIYYVVGMESRSEPLPVPPSGSRGKGPKRNEQIRDEQYRQMWAELEKLVRAHSSTSSQHQEVLTCLLECKKPGPKDNKSGDESDSKSVKQEESSGSFKDYLTKTEIKSEVKRSDSPPVKKFKLGLDTNIGKSGHQSLLTMWTNRIKSLHGSRHDEFAGRQHGANKAELYKHMNEKNGDEEDTKPTNIPLPPGPPPNISSSIQQMGSSITKPSLLGPPPPLLPPHRPPPPGSRGPLPLQQTLSQQPASMVSLLKNTLTKRN